MPPSNRVFATQNQHKRTNRTNPANQRESRVSIPFHLILPPRRATASKILKIRIILPHHLIGILILVGVLLGVDIEALGVSRVPNRGDDGPAVALLVDCVPVNAGEEGVGLDLGGAARDVTEAAGAVDGAELADDVLGGVADGGLLRENDGLFDDSVGRDGVVRMGRGLGSLVWVGVCVLLVDLDRVLVPKRWIAREELVDEDP